MTDESQKKPLSPDLSDTNDTPSEVVANPTPTPTPLVEDQEAQVASTVEGAAESSSHTTSKTSPTVARPLPANQLVLPVIPIREGVLFPSTESVLSFSRTLSIEAIQQSARTQNLVVLLTQKKANTNTPGPSDLYTVGTLAIVEKTLKADEEVNALVRGIGRVKIIRFVKTQPSMLAQVIKLEDVAVKDDESRALADHLQKEFRKAVHMGKPVEFLNFMKLMGGVTDGELVDQIGSTLNIKTREKQQLLETLEVKKRLEMVIAHLAHETKVLEIEKDVVHKTQEKFDKHMRESVLRERLRTIQKELGEFDDEEQVLSEYEQKLKKIKFSPEVKDKVVKEIKRLKQMSVNNPESGYVRTWLDTIFELPWGVTSKGNIDLKKAETILAKNHYGLQEVKDRILEYIAVLQLKQKHVKKDDKSKGRLPTILCFVGPPGVGKTSIGRSVAEALGREFVKISLGGVRDEAEIRGHRRTYVGAMPGKIISGIKQAKSMNPVFMLDEIDKLGNDYRGDPSAALLEALDPEQNFSFEDHYLDVAFDLSDVLFVTTANTLETIPPALRDRLEIIRYAGYTEEEKFHIAKDHLFKKVLTANGLEDMNVALNDELIHTVIQRYTREAGVRELERTLGKLMRKVARTLIEESGDQPKTKTLAKTKAKAEEFDVTASVLRKYLGPEQYDITLAEAEDQVGLATGLAWTSVGGDVLFIEVALTPGKGMVKLTGKLGDVMKESAQAALTYVKANAKELGISDSVLNKTDVHIHIPEGAVPKDGPSAGITLTTAIVSAFTKRPVKREIAMTGEVTLRGRVLRIGGLKEKSIAAHRAGSVQVLIPKDNERDLEEIPESVKENITFTPVSHVSEVLKLALQPAA